MTKKTTHVFSYSTEDAVPSEESKMNVEDIVPFSVFRNIECGDHCDRKHPGTCKALDRMIAALDYHQFMIVNPMREKYGDDAKDTFISFCDELYPKAAMLNDYIHFVEHHSDPSSIEYIKGRLHMKCDCTTKCGATTRHYRDRREDHDHEHESNWFIDRIDSVHFMIHHLTELGLRVSMETLQSGMTSSDEKENDAENKDLALKRMLQVIQTKRKFFSAQRLDGVMNTKFTLQINQKKEGGNAKGTAGLLSVYIFSTFYLGTK